MNEKSEPRRGRPFLGERVPLGLRVTPDMKRRLDEAAGLSGRSQSQEAEFRLERSFDRTDLLTEVLVLAYGARLGGLLVLLGNVMQEAASATIRDRRADKDDWTEDNKAFATAKLAASMLLEAASPTEGPPKIPSYQNAAEPVRRAIRALNRIGHASSTQDYSSLRVLLGSVAGRMTEGIRSLYKWQVVAEGARLPRKRVPNVDSKKLAAFHATRVAADTVSVLQRMHPLSPDELRQLLEVAAKSLAQKIEELRVKQAS